MSADFRIVEAGDSVLVLELEERIDVATNGRAVAAAAAVEAARIPGVRDVVPTFRSVGVHFDPLRADRARLVDRVQRAATEPLAPAAVRSSAIRIPVRYGGEGGPDLAAVAEFGGIDEAEVIARHAAPTYRVFMLGFLPGFAYLASVDPVIAAPRRAEPRVRVAAGSVGIAGIQTGIYPMESPGGWQLIGQTPVRPYDPARQPPFLFRAGDLVQFYPMNR
jgi:KipI family sensor histidine kinase inhibitor